MKMKEINNDKNKNEKKILFNNRSRVNRLVS